MTNKTYNILFEPEDSEYLDLLDYAISECAYFHFILRDTIGLSVNGEEIIKSLSSFLIAKIQTTEWPGTILINSEATLYKYHLNFESATILKRSSTRLFQWQQPNLPEDLCILRADDSPWLVTIAHEKDGFLILSKAEIAHLLKTMPKYRSILEIAVEKG